MSNNPAPGLTGSDTYYEDFQPGQRIRHARGVTIDAVTSAFMAKSVMNTAQVHWNDRADRDTVLGPGFVVFGLLTASTVLGLASQDTSENAVRELSYDDFRFTAPVYHGDTVYAYSEVASVDPHADRDDVGVVEFIHWGLNHQDTVVFRGVRRVQIRKRGDREHT